MRIPKLSLPIIVLLGAIILIGGWQAAQALVSRSNGAGAAHTAGHQIRQPFADNSGLLAWYPLDGDMKDYSGGGHDSTPTGFTYDGTTNGYIPGKFGKGLLFNGTTDYGAQTSSITLPGTAFTLSVWFKTTYLSGSSDEDFFTDFTYPGSGVALFWNGGGSKNICMRIRYDSSGWHDADMCATGIATTDNDGAWHHLVGTYDGTNAKLYNDGVLVTGPTAMTFSGLLGAVSIGDLTDNVYPYHGALDDARIYGRALSAAEVTQLYQGSQPQNCDQTCTSWWKMDETSGTTANDATGTPQTLQFERSLVVDHTKVPNTDQTNFPVLVSITDTTLKTAAHGGNVQNANGYDIEFFSDAALTTKLTWEMESYNATTGAVVAWVKIPTLSHTADTTFYMGYDGPSISSFQSTASSVWDSNFIGVWHLPDGTTLSANDSTSHGYNGTLVNTPTAGTGEVGGAATFNGSNQYIDIASGPTVNYSQITVEAWIQYAGFANDPRFVANSHTDSDNNGFQLVLRKVATNGDSGFFDVGNGSTESEGTFDGTSHSPLVTGTYYHLVGTYNGSTIKMYINGVAQNNGTLTGSIASSGFDINIGRNPAYNGSFVSGNIDEVRISNTARSTDWIDTEYNNESAPGTFITVGPQISLVGNPGTLFGFVFTPGTDGWTTGVFGNGLQFNGSSDYVETALFQTDPTTFSLSAWFKTTVAGGQIIGFEQTAYPLTGANYDRHIYINTSGQVSFGVFPGHLEVRTSSASYNDGNWHLATATLSSAGQFLYIDGTLVASSANTGAQVYNGYWHIGAGDTGGWPSNGSNYFSGSIDDVRIYSRALSASEVYDMYTAGR